MDVLVLGGGPAGVAVSLLMAAKGYFVEVVDSAFFPRTKICGEFLNPQAVDWLAAQNLKEDLLGLNPYPIHGMKITDHQGHSFTGTYPSNRACGYAISRMDFDTLLIQKARQAGITVTEGFRAERLLFENDRVVGVEGCDAEGAICEKRARVIVGADGRNNLVGRTFGWMKGYRSIRKYVYMTYFDSVSGLSHHGEIHLVSGGYLGIAPLTERLANVALVVDEKFCPPQDVDPESFLLTRLRSGSLASRFENLNPIAPVVTGGPLAFRMTHISGSGTLLVGDACGFIDPFTGEGINYAFLSSQLAAAVLDKAIRTNSVENLREYDTHHRKMFRAKLALTRLLQRAVLKPRLASFLIRRFARKAELADDIVSALGSRIPIETVFNIRFATKVLLARTKTPA